MVRLSAWLWLLLNVAVADAAWSQTVRELADLPAEARLQDTPEHVPCKPEGGGTLTLVLSPPDALVELPDIDAEYVAGMTLQTCSVRVAVRRNGYVSETAVIELLGDTRESITLEVAPRGTLTLELSPSDAEVTLPGVRQSYRPAVAVPTGPLRVTVSREGYETASRTISIVGDTVARIELPPLPPGTLTLDVFPGDAVVELLGVDEPYARGMTLPAGSVNVRVSRRGYRELERTIDVDDETRELIELELRTSGTLVFDLFPADIEVVFPDEDIEGGYQRGMTLPVGPVRVAFRRDGYRDLVRIIDIVGDVRELIELQPLPMATLILDLSPKDAVVDLPDLGQRYWPGMPLTLGEHRVVVSQDGYEDFDETIALEGDKTLKIELRPTRTCRPTLVRSFKPAYPPDARSKEVEGYVEIEFQIVKTGIVRDAFVVAASPPDIFDQAAINAIRKFRYSLPREDCESVESVSNKVRFRFDFRDR